MVDTNEIRWAAGFLEADGCFGYYPKSSGHRVQVAQLRIEPLVRLSKLFGGPSLKTTIRKTNKGSEWIKPGGIYHLWYTTGARARGIMMTVYGLVSKPAQERIRKALCENQRAWFPSDNHKRRIKSS